MHVYMYMYVCVYIYVLHPFSAGDGLEDDDMILLLVISIKGLALERYNSFSFWSHE
jgi:hypothetical protein